MTSIISTERDMHNCHIRSPIFRRAPPVQQAVSMMKWPYQAKSRRINDNVYGCINLPYPLDKIVDTVCFQRLRNLKQTGLVYLVFPNCDHSRFVHSLGTFHLCFVLTDKLRHAQPHLQIDDADHLCLCVAALCHDLGHGTYSHLYDGEFARQLGKNFKHEQMSVRLIRWLLNMDSIRVHFEPFLGTGDVYQNNVTFITALISEKPFEDQEAILADFEDLDLKGKREKMAEQWDYIKLGRTIDKSFLFDIVSNSTNGHDVDKMDYLLRDSKASGVPISLNYDVVNRLFNAMSVAIDPSSGLLKIAYSKKCYADIAAIGDSRRELHDKVYQHKAVRSMEVLMVQAMIKADSVLLYKGSGGRLFKLSEVFEDEEAYIRTSDFVAQEIMNSTSTDPDVVEAQNLLQMLNERQHRCKIDNYDLSLAKVRNLEQNNACSEPKFICEEIHSIMDVELDGSFRDQYDLHHRVLGKGLDELTHPIEKQVFFDGKSDCKQDKTPVGEYVDMEYVENTYPAMATKWEIFVVGDRSLTSEEKTRIKKAFRSAGEKMRLLTPRKRTMSGSPEQSSSNGQSTAKRQLFASQSVSA